MNAMWEIHLIITNVNYIYLFLIEFIYFCFCGFIFHKNKIIFALMFLGFQLTAQSHNGHAIYVMHK